MDNAMTLITVVSALGSFAGTVLTDFYLLAKPTIDLLAPAAIAYLVHRYVSNKAAADLLTDMAGAAYSHIGAQYAAGGKLTFGSARQAAVAAVVAGMDVSARSALAKLSQQEIAKGVDAKLGQILANDPSFSVTDPQGKAALATAIAAARAAIPPVGDAVITPQVQITDVPAAGTPAPSPGGVTIIPGSTIRENAPAAAPAVPQAAPNIPNFDLTSLVQDAVRQGMEAALHNGAAR